MEQWEHDHTHQFLFGAEESYGYLIGTHVRDKDAIVASCLISEIALFMKVEGRTLIDFLKDIYKKYGFFLEKQRTIDFPPDKEGMEKMGQMMDTLRKKTPQAIMGQKIEVFEDYKKSLHNLPPVQCSAFSSC